MMAIWERSIRPTLYDYGGQALVCSNAAGKDIDNFFYNICSDPRHGFHEHHATTMDNPHLPKRLADESEENWLRRREQFRADLISENDPLVYAQNTLPISSIGPASPSSTAKTCWLTAARFPFRRSAKPFSR